MQGRRRALRLEVCAQWLRLFAFEVCQGPLRSSKAFGLRQWGPRRCGALMLQLHPALSRRRRQRGGREPSATLPVSVAPRLLPPFAPVRSF